MSSTMVPHIDEVNSVVIKIYGRRSSDDLDDLDVNAPVWSIFLNTTLQTAVHLGPDLKIFYDSVKMSLWGL